MLFTGTMAFILVLLIILKTFKIVPNHQSFVKERFGKFNGVLEPGFHFLIPFVDRIAYVQDLREQVLDVPAQNCITKDNIQVEVDGVVYLKVMDSEKASYGIENYHLASINLCQTTMRSQFGKLSLDDTFSERDAMNENIVKEVDLASDPWGIKVLRYEIKNITPSRGMIDTMEKQMEAERSKRAQITLANAEKQATINQSTAVKQEKINISEGERQRQINVAEGKSAEIKLIAEATAQGVKMVSDAIAKPGGQKAVQMRLVDRYLGELGNILEESKVTVVPAQLANIKGVFEGIGKVSTALPDTEKIAKVSE